MGTRLCYWIFIVIICSVLGCNLEQSVDINLPKHNSQLVVECYLEPGQKARLLLTESSGYFDQPRIPFVNNATVVITYKGYKDTLEANKSFDENDVKVFNYISRRAIPEDYNEEFFLDVSEPGGRKLKGKTKLTLKTNIDSATANFRDSTAYLLVSFRQKTGIDDYYRIIIHKDSLNNIIQNFTFTDEFSDTEKISIGTGYEFKKGSRAFVTLYHIDRSYYDYLQTMEAARSANSNPFAQPATIKSNVEGGIGIFTSLTFDFKSIIID